MKTGILSAFLIALSGIAFSGDDGKEVSGKWLFDDPENFLGSSVNRQELRGYASPAKGIVGGGAHFNGNSEFLELAFTPEIQPGEEMTAAFWFKAEPGTDCFPAVRHRNSFFVASGGRGFSWYELTGTKGRVYDGYAHPRELDYNEWYHFALVYNQKELAVYLDGMKIRSVKAENLGAVKPGSTVMIGGRLARFNDKWVNFKGTMDEIEFLKYAKTNWERVRLLKKREQLRKFGKLISGETSWQERFQRFSEAVETCTSDEVAKRTLLPQAEALLKEGENLYHGTDTGFFVKAVSPMLRVMPDDILLQAPTRKARTGKPSASGFPAVGGFAVVFRRAAAGTEKSGRDSGKFRAQNQRDGIYSAQQAESLDVSLSGGSGQVDHQGKLSVRPEKVPSALA